MTSQQPQEPQHTQPTRIRDLPLTLLEKRFSTASLALDYGAAIVRVRSRLGVFVRDFQQVYGAFAVADAPPSRISIPKSAAARDCVPSSDRNPVS
jgi:hypothetical protein